jgi:hypothetical protein
MIEEELSDLLFIIDVIFELRLLSYRCDVVMDETATKQTITGREATVIK